jgi:hypothetical protein
VSPSTLSSSPTDTAFYLNHLSSFRGTLYYSPDYNPIEKLWKKIKQQETHLHYFPTFEVLTEKVEQALLKFTNTPEEILTLCSLPAELAQAA